MLFLILKFLVILYVVICTGLYLFQERMIFFPDRLSKDYLFSFDQPFEELYVSTGNGKHLHGLLFKANRPKGLVFYLHGNAGAVNTWGGVATRYTDNNYDVFILDYPGYGKSDGSIRNQEQLFVAIQAAYDEMKKRYKEDQIVILGYSIGTGPAAKLASMNHAKLLILQAPYYSLKDLMKNLYPVIPTFLLKYKFETNKYLKECRMPVVIFHGDQDEVIYYGSSQKLAREMKSMDTLITLHGQAHNGLSDNPQYIAALKKLLD